MEEDVKAKQESGHHAADGESQPVQGHVVKAKKGFEDISKIEARIRNLQYFDCTSISLMFSGFQQVWS